MIRYFYIRQKLYYFFVQLYPCFLTYVEVIIIIIIIFIIILLATSFGLEMPSKGQYLQKSCKCWCVQYKL
jgi:hypothetical protein